MRAEAASPRAPTPAGLVRLDEAAGRWVLLATVLGSSLAFIDMTVVNVALPRIGLAFHASSAALQWIVNGYTLSLAALILLGGALGDRLGRRRVFALGVTWFAVASLACGLAQGPETLIAARVLQGVGGALLTPGSLAIIEASFRPEDRARAIGAWSGLAGIGGAVGPFLGGWLAEAATWRLVFLINVPLAALVVVVAVRRVPESRDPRTGRRLDLAGVASAVTGLAGVTYGFTAWPAAGLTSPAVAGALALGGAGMLAFVLAERRAPDPLLPLGLFRSRTFTAANLVTLAVYAALGGMLFLVSLNLQVVAGFGPLAAGTALLPVTAVMLLLSAPAGALAQRIGPRAPMTLGPVVCAGALAQLAGVGPGASYLAAVLPGVLALGLGLSLTVPALTATALGAADERHAGIASGVNNAVARTASLLAVAVLPLAAGVGGGSLTDPAVLGRTYPRAMLLCAGLLLVGAATSYAAIPGRRRVEA